MIGIIDYGRGNLRSVEKAFHFLGYPAFVSDSPARLEKAKALVLPGVGAFDDAMRRIRAKGWDRLISEYLEHGFPFLGICLGYQVLFERSEEGGDQPGLGIFAGEVRRFPSQGLKVPHMGWNSIRIRKESRLIDPSLDGAFFYFVHSYYVVPEDAELVVTETDYGISFASAVERGNIFAFQFHPEKSSQAGLSILKRFAELGCSE
jgi:glutamine amidotransferase